MVKLYLQIVLMCNSILITKNEKNVWTSKENSYPSDTSLLSTEKSWLILSVCLEEPLGTSLLQTSSSLSVNLVECWEKEKENSTYHIFDNQELEEPYNLLLFIFKKLKESTYWMQL